MRFVVQLRYRFQRNRHLSLSKMLSGANAFEISDIERMNIGAQQPAASGRNNVICPVVAQNNNSPATGIRTWWLPRWLTHSESRKSQIVPSRS
jgi:hypothetical protein